MNVQKPVFRGLLFLEVVMAFAFPCIVLLFGTVVGIVATVASIMDMRFEGLLVLCMIAGGYLGMIGVLNQFNFLLGDGAKSLGWKTFACTLIGCLAVSPFTYMLLDSGKFPEVLVGLAPILVAIQLTFMNRQQLYLILKANKEKC